MSSFGGPSSVPPVHLGPTQAAGSRERQQKREQPQRRPPQEAEHDEVELSGQVPEGTPEVIVTPAVMQIPKIPAAGGAYPAKQPSAPAPVRHIDLNG